MLDVDQELSSSPLPIVEKDGKRRHSFGSKSLRESKENLGKAWLDLN